jgi:hypothetical protein
MLRVCRAVLVCVLAGAVGLAPGAVADAQEAPGAGPRTVRVALDVGTVGGTVVRVTPPEGLEATAALDAAERLVRAVGPPARWFGPQDATETSAQLEANLAQLGPDQVTLTLDSTRLQEAARAAGFSQLELVVCHDPLPARVITQQGAQSTALGTRSGGCAWTGQRWLLPAAAEPMRATLTLDAGTATRIRALALLAGVLLGAVLLGAAAGALAASRGRAFGRLPVLAAAAACMVPAGVAAALAATVGGLASALTLAAQDGRMLRLVPLAAAGAACLLTVAGVTAGVWLVGAGWRRGQAAWQAAGGELPEEGVRVYTLEEAAAALQLTPARAARLLGAGILRWGQDQRGNTGITARSLAAERRVQLQHRSGRVARRALEAMLGPLR